MKKIILITATMLMSQFNSILFAQTVAWTLAYETYTLPVSDVPAMHGKSDYDANGNLYSAGRSNPTASFVTIDKINLAGTVVASVIYPNNSTHNNVIRVKVFRNAFGMNFIYVLVSTSTTGSSSDGLLLLKYDSNLNLLHSFVRGITVYPYHIFRAFDMDVEQINGNAIIEYDDDGINKMSRMNPDLTIAWTRILPSIVLHFKYCPTSDWIAMISSDGLQRISATNVVVWTVSTITLVSALDISVSGDIYLTNGITLKKYNASGVLLFSSVHSGTAASPVKIKTSSFGGAFVAFDDGSTIRIKYFNSSGSSPWGAFISTTTSPSASRVNGLEEIDGYAFISIHKRTVISPGFDGRDSSFLIKYSPTGTLIYRDGFSVPLPPSPGYSGIASLGITRYKTQIAVYGSQKVYTPPPNHTRSWYLRIYGPIARIASTETEAAGLEFSVYPNPVSEILNVKLDAATPAKLELVNATGQTVYSENVNSDRVQINVAGLKPGIYYLNYNDGSSSRMEAVSINR